MQLLSAAKIQAAGLFDLNTLQYQAGFTVQQAASTAAGGREFPSLIFRGLQSTYGGGQDNSGSLFVDGIYISAGQASIDTIDVTQIELLKGPQNVYFGKNTFASASTRVQTTRIQVDGYTDLSGTTGYNQKLSIRRAQTVQTELVRDGVPMNEISIHGYGESNPLVPTAQGVREPQNRRVEIILK